MTRIAATRDECREEPSRTEANALPRLPTPGPAARGILALFAAEPEPTHPGERGLLH